MTPTDVPPPRSRSWMVLIPLGIVVLITIIWSGVWVYASNRAEHELDAWVDREARLGRIWSCPERSLTGFPFRFELRCREPSLETRGGDTLRLTAQSAHVVAQIWAPNHMVAEFTPPARIEDATTGAAYDATWSLLQMSGVGDLSGRPQRFALVVHDPKITPIAEGDPGEPIATARLFEFHARVAPQPEGGPGNVDYAAGLTGGESALLAVVGEAGPIDMSLEGTLTAAANLRPMPLKQRLRAWAAAHGMALLKHFSLTTPQMAASAQGALSLDEVGRLNGHLDLGFAGLDKLVGELGNAGVIPSEMSPIVGALAMVGRQGMVEGRKGVTFAIGFKNGTLRLGGFPVGLVPPAF